jgi:hypothetical protein
MARKKKKKIEEDAWMWMSQPSVPGMVSKPFFNYSFISSPTERASSRGTAAEEGRSWGTNVPYGKSNAYEGGWDAWKYYAIVGLLDPKLPLEAGGWALLLSSPYRVGLLVAAVVGVVVTGTALTIIDPAHKWEGGLDETPGYEDAERQYLEMRAPWKTQYVPSM